MVNEINQKTNEEQIREDFLESIRYYEEKVRTLPKPIFVIDTDQGQLTNRGIEGIDYVEIAPDKIEQGAVPVGWQQFKEGMAYFKANREKYKTLVWDSLTTLMDAALAYLMFLNRHQITGKKDDAGATLPDLNMEKQLVTSQLMEALGMGKHFFCICHEEVVKHELTGIVARMPVARGQLQGKIGVYFDEVYHCRMKMDKEGKIRPFWLVKSDSPLYTYKTRLGNSAEVEPEQQADFLAYAKKCGVSL
jgi:hypothetical protein